VKRKSDFSLEPSIAAAFKVIKISGEDTDMSMQNQEMLKLRKQNRSFVSRACASLPNWVAGFHRRSGFL